MIPLVIFHIGVQDYFKQCVLSNSKYNKVYIIGDNENNIFIDKNIEHINMNDLESDDIIEFKKYFINYSTNSYSYELYCFLRIFYVKEFCLRYNYEKIFHIDSDCIVFENINNIFFKNINIAYSIQDLEQTKNEFHMVGCVHNALLNILFCNKFIELCFDIYRNKSKFYLIEPKINWHVNNYIQGGICDMTLYYLLFSEKIIDDIFNTNNVLYIDNELCVFDHQISGSYGFNGDGTYLIENNIKKIIKKNKKYYIVTINNEEIRSLSFHYQGEYKKIMGSH